MLASDGTSDYIYFQTRSQVESATSDVDIGPGEDQPLDAASARKRPPTGAENRSLHSIVVTRFNIEITTADLKTLENTEYLNDNIINYYFGMIVQRSANLNVFAFSTFFMDYLYLDKSLYDYRSVARWSLKFNPFELDKLFVPIHEPLHWTFIIIYFQKKVIHYYDSFHRKGATYRNAMLCWLKDEARIRRIPFDASDWQSVDIKNSPSQTGNGTCCGVFAVMSADYLSNDIPLSASTFGLGDIPDFRRKIAADIIRGYLDAPSGLLGNDDQGTSICLLYI